MRGGGIASKTLTLEFRTNGRAGAISVIKMRRSKWCGPRSDRSVVLETAIISVISVKIVRRDRWSDISKFFQSLQLDDSKNKVFGANFFQPSTTRFDIYIYIYSNRVDNSHQSTRSSTFSRFIG